MNWLKEESREALPKHMFHDGHEYVDGWKKRIATVSLKKQQRQRDKGRKNMNEEHIYVFASLTRSASNKPFLL